MKDNLPSAIILADDDLLRESISQMIASAGYRVHAFSDEGHFLSQGQFHAPCCAVLDFYLADLNGLDLLRRLKSKYPWMPVVFITQCGTIEKCVQAIKLGATEFLPKPFQPAQLITAINRSLDEQRLAMERGRKTFLFQQSVSGLTTREFEVFKLVVRGLLNKQIAAQLGICEKTVKLHRGRVMRKTKANSLAELVQMAEKAGLINELEL